MEPDRTTVSTAENRTSTFAAKRKLAVIAAAVVVVLVGAVVVVTQISPTKQQNPVAAGQSASLGGGSTAAPEQTPQPLGRNAAEVPAAAPDAFDAWVNRISGWLDIPQRAMRSYANVTVVLNKSDPACHMSWVTLAGIGKQATDHGRAGGGIGASGMPAHSIGNVELRDFFGKRVSDLSARGPMQLTPANWRRFGGSAAGAKSGGNIQNLDDAALATGKQLCSGKKDLADGGTWWNAVGTVDSSPLFLHRVLATATMYGTVAQNPNPPKPQPLHAVEFAITKIGLPYVWGGNGKGGADDGGFDCSGLTTAAYAAQGITLRRMADWQFRDTPPVPKNQEPQLGDLVFFGNPATKIHHVGMYIGNHQMVDAPDFGQAVQVHVYHKPGDDFAGAGRVVA